MKIVSVPALLVCASAVLAPLARAQFQVGLQTQYRLVSTSAPSELRVDTSFLVAASSLLNSDTNAGSTEGSSTSSSITVSNTYGNMSVTGSGYATNSAARGAFAFIDTPLGGAPYALYQDVFHVNSSTLAVGTAVTINFSEVFSASFSNTEPIGSQGFGSPSFQDILHISDNQGTSRWDVSLDATGSASYAFQTHVGDTLNVRGELHGYDFATANTLQTPPVTATYSFSAAGPLYVDSVSEGVDLTAESGATYTRSASVPDGASTSLLLGASVLGLLAVRRRRR